MKKEQASKDMEGTLDHLTSLILAWRQNSHLRPGVNHRLHRISLFNNSLYSTKSQLSANIALNGDNLKKIVKRRAHEQDQELDEEFAALTAYDTASFPDELLTLEYNPEISQKVIMKSPGPDTTSVNYRRKIRSIEMREESSEKGQGEGRNGKRRRVSIKKELIEPSGVDNEDVLVGDYKYSFCEEEGE